MNNVKQAVPFFWVTDITVSIDFYVKRLGFEVKNSWTTHGRMRWCWLEMGGAALMLQELKADGQYPTVPDEQQSGKGVEIYFICQDALKIYDQIK